MHHTLVSGHTEIGTNIKQKKGELRSIENKNALLKVSSSYLDTIALIKMQSILLSIRSLHVCSAYTITTFASFL